MKKLRLLFFGFLFLSNVHFLHAQRNDAAASKSDIEYEMMYDEPYDLYKMWIQFTPLYTDFFSSNFNVGYGLQGNYLLKDKWDFKIQYRKTYAKATDFTRAAGDKSQSNSNKLTAFQYLEGGATYHIRDQADAGTSRMVVTSKRYSDDKLAANVPEHIIIPSKVRKTYGVRTGAYYWSSSLNISDVIAKQKVAVVNIADQTDTLTSNTIYGNLQSAGFYLGGSLGRIRNVAIKPKRYDPNTNDVIFTAYADIIFAPSVTLENIKVRDQTTKKDDVYDVKSIQTKKLGFRLGFEGMYNKEFSWSWGGELGYRPSVQGRGFYVLAKVSIAFATRFDQKRTATQITKPTE